MKRRIRKKNIPRVICPWGFGPASLYPAVADPQRAKELYIFLLILNVFHCSMLMKLVVLVSFTITYCIFWSKILKLLIFYSDFRLRKLILTCTNFVLISHCANFRTWFNILLVFQLHCYLVHIILQCSLRIFLKFWKILEFQIFSFDFLLWKFVSTWTNLDLVSQCGNFGTWFNMVLLFEWHC